MTAEEFTNAHPGLAQFWHPVALSGLEFPLDVAAALHTRADRVSVEFRRVLAAAVGG